MRYPTPETHRTISNREWRFLDLKGHPNSIAVMQPDGKEYGYYFLPDEENGVWGVYDGCGVRIPNLTLVPKLIVVKPNPHTGEDK